jgi:ribosomal-protein-alanine N-acetyltransferase
MPEAWSDLGRGARQTTALLRDGSRGYDGAVPRLVMPVVPAGRMREGAQPVLRLGDDLTLRPWRPADASVLMDAFADPDIRYWHIRELATEDEARSWIASWPGRWDAETDGSWAVAEPGTGVPMGQIALRMVNLEFGQGHITYWVLPRFRGHGVASRAVAGLARWATEDLGLHRLVIQHSVANPASCRVAERSGFTLEGTMRSELLHADGWHDMHLDALVAGDPATAPGDD